MKNVVAALLLFFSFALAFSACGENEGDSIAPDDFLTSGQIQVKVDGRTIEHNQTVGIYSEAVGSQTLSVAAANFDEAVSFAVNIPSGQSLIRTIPIKSPQQITDNVVGAIGYVKNSTIVHDNLNCATPSGSIQITSFNQANRTVSGNFKGIACSANNGTVTVEGSFKDFVLK